MTTRMHIAVGVIVALIVFPFLLVQAQSEGEVGVPPEAEVATVPAEPDPAASPESNTAVRSEGEAANDIDVEEPVSELPAEEGSMLGEATTTDVASSSEGVAPEEAQAAVPEPEGEVLGESDTAEEPGVPAESATTTTDMTTLVAPTASSTEATSTPPIEEPKPIEEPFVLQPGVELSINGNSVSAVITLQNLTCKSCDKVLPEVEVVVYYTEWYPNDGPIADYGASSMHMMEQGMTVADLPNWASRDMSWSAQNVAPGHYYLVVEVDPENTIGAHRMHRSEVEI